MYPASLLALPAELLHQVASCLTLAGNDSDLSNFASTCHTVRLASRSLLFRSMTVASAARLESFAHADHETLGYMRHFTLRLEYDFFEAFAAACQAQCGQSILPALAHILLNAPQLCSLRVQIPDNREDYRASAWTQLLRLNTQGVALGAALARVLPANTTFSALRTLHFDGVSQLVPLVRMTPNLTTLSAHMCEGFAEEACRELVQGALPLVPCLEELAFDPFSLHFASSGLNVPKAIAAVVPNLQTLDLRSRAFDFGSGRTEWRTTDTIDPLDCIPSSSRLRELHLPFAPSANEALTAVSAEPRKATLLSDRARETELLAVIQLASVSPLEKVSWLRADGDEPVEYAIERDEHGIPTRIRTVGDAQVQPDTMMMDVGPSATQGFANSLTSLLATVASSTTFHAAVLMCLLADSSILPLPVSRSIATPALLAAGAALGIVARAC
ncbi:hypothetical protein FRC07_002079 [Ceratobasidium sp. 392]|nr:hypothetical protein FRC07_002079 [Ceratobasidium sp. 392]